MAANNSIARPGAWRTRSALYLDLAALRELGVELAPRSRRADPPFEVLDWGFFRPDRL